MKYKVNFDLKLNGSTIMTTNQVIDAGSPDFLGEISKKIEGLMDGCSRYGVEHIPCDDSRIDVEWRLLRVIS